MVTLHKKLGNLITPFWILLGVRNVSDKSCRESQKTHFVFKNFPFPPPPPENRAVYEIMWRNMVESERTQTTIKCGTEKMRCVCRITKARTRGSMEGASGRAPLPGNLKDEVFDWYADALWAGLPLTGALLGNLEGIHLPGHLREMNSTSEYLCEPGGHSGFKSEWGFNLTQAYLSGFLPFGPRE